MNELIRTSAAIIGGEEQQTVNARELWEKLESKRDFSHWIKDRLRTFSEGLISRSSKLSNVGKSGLSDEKSNMPSLSDVAKHLAMLGTQRAGAQNPDILHRSREERPQVFRCHEQSPFRRNPDHPRKRTPPRTSRIRFPFPPQRKTRRTERKRRKKDPIQARVLHRRQGTLSYRPDRTY